MTLDTQTIVVYPRCGIRAFCLHCTILYAIVSLRCRAVTTSRLHRECSRNAGGKLHGSSLRRMANIGSFNAQPSKRLLCFASDSQGVAGPNKVVNLSRNLGTLRYLLRARRPDGSRSPLVMWMIRYRVPDKKNGEIAASYGARRSPHCIRYAEQWTGLTMRRLPENVYPPAAPPTRSEHRKIDNPEAPGPRREERTPVCTYSMQDSCKDSADVSLPHHGDPA